MPALLDTVGADDEKVGIGRGAMSDLMGSKGSAMAALAAVGWFSRNEVALLISSGKASDFSSPDSDGSNVSATMGWPSMRPSMISGPSSVPSTTCAQPGTPLTDGVSR